MKNPSDTIGNRTRDLPTCNAVPQPTALSRTPSILFKMTNISLKFCLLLGNINQYIIYTEIKKSVENLNQFTFLSLTQVYKKGGWHTVERSMSLKCLLMSNREPLNCTSSQTEGHPNYADGFREIRLGNCQT